MLTKLLLETSRELLRLKCVDNKWIYAGRAQFENMVDHISSAEDRNHWRDVVNAKFKFPVPERANSFLTKWVTTHFWRTLLQTKKRENQYNLNGHNYREPNQWTTVPGNSTLTHVTYLTPVYVQFNSVIDISDVICMVRITAHIVSHLGSEMRTATL